LKCFHHEKRGECELYVSWQDYDILMTDKEKMLYTKIGERIAGG
jgi:hypothetical protein